MTTVDAVREVGLALPRSTEHVVRGRWKLKVKQIVYVACSADETTMGFGFPKVERDGLVASAPDVFFLPGANDLRYQWVCARLARLADDEMCELVTDAWRMCVPRMLQDLPDLPAPTGAAWSAMDARDWPTLRPLLHPYLHWSVGGDGDRGRVRFLDWLTEHPTPRPPVSVEIRDGQVYRWTGGPGTSRRRAQRSTTTGTTSAAAKERA